MPTQMNPADDLRYPLFMLPIWAREPFVSCFRAWEDQGSTLSLATEGIQLIERHNHPELIERWFGALPDDLSGAFRTVIEQGRYDTVRQAIARSERVLLVEATIMLWGSLEIAIEDFLVAWYKHNPTTLVDHRVSQVKVSIPEFEAMSADERGLYLINQLKQKLSAAEKASVNRFESLLGAFGLSGSVDEDARRVLLELGHVRNILVHRAGLADNRLTKACSWLGLSDGDLVPLSREQYMRYASAADQYLAAVIHGLYPRFGWEYYTTDSGETGWRQPDSSATLT